MDELSLHRAIAAERLRADEGWRRYDTKNEECLQLRELIAAKFVAPSDAITSDGTTYHNVPDIGTKWRHHNGAIYVVDSLSNTESKNPTTYPPTVVYRNLVNNKVWSRPLSDWHRSMTRIPDDDAPHKARFKEGCNCGCNIPIATDPIQMLRFLAGRLEAAGVSSVVAEVYARDIRTILAIHKERT